MNKEQVTEIINFISDSYKYFEPTEILIEAWQEELYQYDYEQVKNSLKSYMAEDRFQSQPPTIYMLVKNLPKIYDKIDFTKDTFYCDICNKAYNDLDQLEKHRDKCSSIRYVIKQNKKWFNRTIDKKFLWQLSDEEFEERYNKLLKYIMEHTTDENEKTRIGYIFNPPSAEEAREFLKGGI